MLVVASTKFSIISLINFGRANLFLPILSPKKGILLELPKARHNLIENQGKRGILLEPPKANNIRKQGNKKRNLVGATKSTQHQKTRK